MRPRRFSRKWLLAGLVVVVAAGAAALLSNRFGGSPELRDRVAASLSEWTGGTVTLTEPLRVRYFPPSLQGGLVLSNVSKLPGVQTLTAPNFKVTLGFPAFLTGRVQLDTLQLRKPTVTLKESPSPYTALLTSALGTMPMQTIRVRNGKIVSPAGEKLVRKLDVRLNSLGNKGALAMLGSLIFNGEKVAFSLDSGKIAASADVPVTLKVTSKPITARFSGAVRTEDDPQADGTIEAKLPDARDFLKWVGIDLPDGGSFRDVRASGTAHWSGPTLTFDDGAFAFDGNEAVGLFALTAGPRPRIEGTLAFETLTLDPYISAAESPPATAPFDWVLLKFLDADLRVSAGEVAVRDLKARRGGFTVRSKDGRISTEVGELELCGGQAAGRLELDLTDARTHAALTGSLADIAFEPCLVPFALGVPLKGTGTITFDVSTEGATRETLIRGSSGTVEITAREGVVPIDFPQLAAASSTQLNGWSQDGGTAFDALDADCSLSAGNLWCHSLRLDTREGVVSGSGGLDVTRQTLDWDLLIADPVVSADASHLIMKSPPRITVNGSLSVPRIRRVDRAQEHPQPVPEGATDPR